MKLKKSTLLFFLVVSFSLSAQKKFYLDRDGEFVAQEKASQYAIQTEESKESIRVDFYSLANVLRKRQYFTVFNKNNRIKNGPATYFYPDGSDSLTYVCVDSKIVGQRVEFFPSGEKRVVCNYVDGLLHGLLFQYYLDGNLRRKEQYLKGKCVHGQLFDESGNELPFEPYYVAPEIPGGAKTLMEFLSKNIKYPINAMRQNRQGRVLIDFIVEKDGSLSNPKISKSIDSDLDIEALRVVKKLGETYKWIPATLDGKPQRVRFTLPVVFRLGASYSF